jgi:hypothetical protein
MDSRGVRASSASDGKIFPLFFFYQHRVTPSASAKKNATTETLTAGGAIKPLISILRFGY